jgi:hypothetical protein
MIIQQGKCFRSTMVVHYSNREDEEQYKERTGVIPSLMWTTNGILSSQQTVVKSRRLFTAVEVEEEGGEILTMVISRHPVCKDFLKELWSSLGRLQYIMWAKVELEQGQ